MGLQVPKKVERMKPPYIPLYVRDLLSSIWVDQMDDQQFGWYIRMLLRSWDYELPCHIPNTPDMILIFAKANQVDFDKKGWLVLGRFQATADGKHIFNRRLLSEYEGIIGKYKANAKAARKRWDGNSSGSRRQSVGNAVGMRSHAEGIASVVDVDSKRNAIPESEAESDADTKNKEKPSARKTRRAAGTPDASQVAKTQGDNRHSRSKQMVEGFYRDWAGVKCPWDGAEAGNLSKILKAWPDATDLQFATCLENIGKSECIPKGTRPCEWLCKLPKFLHGPLDQFWKAKGIGNGNGNHKTAAAGRANRNVEALVLSSMGTSVQRVHVPDGGAVQPGTPDRKPGREGSFPDGEILEREPKRP